MGRYGPTAIIDATGKLHCNYYESRAEMYRTNQNRDSLGWKVLISMAKVREFAPHSSHRAHGDFLVGS